MIENDEIEIDLLRIMQALWKKVWVIVLVAAIFGGAMFAYGKYTYVPQYTATATLYTNYQNNQNFSHGESAANISQGNLTDSRALVATWTSLLKTRMIQEEVIQLAGLDMSCSQLAAMITAEAVDKTEIFTVKVTANNAKEAALIANTVAQILPEKAAMVNPNSDVGIIDTALVPSAPDGNDIVKNAAIAAFVGAFLICCVVGGKEIAADWKEQKTKKENA